MTLDEALRWADVWTDLPWVEDQGPGSEAMLVLAAEVRRLQALLDARNAEPRPGSNPVEGSCDSQDVGGIAPLERHSVVPVAPLGGLTSSQAAENAQED